MIDGVITGAVDDHPRITSKGDETIVSVKVRVANGSGTSLYANAYGYDEEPQVTLAQLRRNDIVLLFGALIVRAWPQKDGKSAKPGLDIIVTSATQERVKTVPLTRGAL
jgi:hypothetical protein